MGLHRQRRGATVIIHDGDGGSGGEATRLRMRR